MAQNTLPRKNAFSKEERSSLVLKGSKGSGGERQLQINWSGGNARSDKATPSNFMVQSRHALPFQMQNVFQTEQQNTTNETLAKTFLGDSPQIKSDGAVGLSNVDHAKLDIRTSNRFQEIWAAQSC